MPYRHPAEVPDEDLLNRAAQIRLQQRDVTLDESERLLSNFPADKKAELDPRNKIAIYIIENREQIEAAISGQYGEKPKDPINVGRFILNQAQLNTGIPGDRSDMITNHIRNGYIYAQRFESEKTTVPEIVEALIKLLIERDDLVQAAHGKDKYRTIKQPEKNAIQTELISAVGAASTIAPALQTHLRQEAKRKEDEKEKTKNEHLPNEASNLATYLYEEKAKDVLKKPKLTDKQVLSLCFTIVTLVYIIGDLKAASYAMAVLAATIAALEIKNQKKDVEIPSKIKTLYAYLLEFQELLKEPGVIHFTDEEDLKRKLKLEKALLLLELIQKLLAGEEAPHIDFERFRLDDSTINKPKANDPNGQAPKDVADIATQEHAQALEALATAELVTTKLTTKTI